jgi:multidrug efflux pump subunit AcrB
MSEAPSGKGLNLSDWALRHRSFVWFLMTLSLAAGAFAYPRLGRDENPSFTLKAMVVNVRWPGASTEETMRQVTDRIERKLQETPGLFYLKSYTKPGDATVFVWLTDATPPSKVKDVWYQVRKKVGDIRQTLPQGIQGPFFNDEFGETYGLVYAFTSDGFTDRQLRDQVENFRNRLLAVDGVSKINLVGTQDEKIWIEFDTRRLAGLGVSASAVIDQLRSQNSVTPSGTVQSPGDRVLVRVSGAFVSEQSLRDVNLYVSGRYLRLADIATIRRGPVDPPAPLFRYNGQPAIGLAISMAEGGNILTFGEAIKARVATLKAELPVGIEPHLVADQSAVVEKSVDGFVKALWEAVGIVLLVSFISLGLRAGAVVALSIPLVLTLVFVVMDMAGIAFQRVSLGALIIALGLLVDDAMITVEMMISQLERGATRIAAATTAYTTTAFPMLTGTLVTIAGFVPVGFAKSSAGEFTYSLFVVIAAALLISWVVAVLFAPLLGVLILPARLKHAHVEPGSRKARINAALHGLLLSCLRRPWLVIGITVALFVLSLGALKLVPQQFFPASDRNEVMVDLGLPPNASIAASKTAALKLEGLLKNDPDVASFSTSVGEGAVRFYLPLNLQLPNEFFAQTVVVAKDLPARDRIREKLEKRLPPLLPDVVTRVYPLELGPPVGWPLQFRLSGPDPDKVQQLGYRLADIVAADREASNVNFDWGQPARSMRLEIDQDQARRLGVTSESLATALQTVTSGVTITQVRDDIYLIDVVARAQDGERNSVDALRALQIPRGDGGAVPITAVASFVPAMEYPLIWRRDRQPTVTVQADPAHGAQAKSIASRIEAKLASFEKSLPPGYSVSVGGTPEASARSIRSVVTVLPLMGLLMLTLLMIQLHSFSRLALVISVAPLGLIGVALALLTTSTPLGFVALLGIVALVGMIIRNSVILIDQVKENEAGGEDPWNALVSAVTHRARPILLTAAAAICGMIPIASDVFWGPLAYAIIGGLITATLLTLLFLPALYVVWFRMREPSPE